MFKLFVFACILAVAVAKPGALLYTAPAIAAPALAGAPIAYSGIAPIAYSSLNYAPAATAYKPLNYAYNYPYAFPYRAPFGYSSYIAA